MKLRPYTILVAIALLVFVAMFTGCDKRNAPIVATPIPTDSLLHIVSMEASTDTVYADNGITFSTVSVLVKDKQNFAAVAVPVLFRTNIGGIIRQVTTDSSGVATTTFYSRGPAETGVAKVEAFLRTATNVPMDSAFVNVHIIPVPEVSNLSLEMNSTNLTVDQTVVVRAKAKNVLGSDVADKTILTFSASRGYFLNDDDTVAGDSILVQTSHGNASIRYNAGPLAGVGEIRVRIGHASTSRLLTILPGRAARLDMSSYVLVDGVVTPADEAPVNGPHPIYIRSLVTDMHNNIVPNVMVRFETSLGTFNSMSTTTNKNTDSLGIADVRFTPGISAGESTIKGYANGDTLQSQILFTVTSDEIYSIQFENTGNIQLDVQHTGGTESAIVRVKLVDLTGNLIDTPTEVKFTLLGTVPTGANLNNLGTGPVSTISIGGIAQVSVNSGTSSGVLKLEARVVKDDSTHTVVRAEKANLVIQAGPPASIQLGIGGYNSGEQLGGGGMWRVVAQALVKDAYGNPVKNGTMVFFSLPEDQPNPSIDATTTIGASGAVGAESVQSDSLPGVAFTTVTYNGIYTFEQIRVKAQTLGENNLLLSSQRDLELPLTNGTITGMVTPNHVDWFDSGPGSNTIDQVVDVFGTLREGYGLPVHNATLVLSSERGWFVYYVGTNLEYPNPTVQDPNTQQAVYIITDWYNPNWLDSHGQHLDVPNNDNEGRAQGKMKARRYECPPATLEGPGTYTINITITLLNTDLVAETGVTLNRFGSAAGK